MNNASLLTAPTSNRPLLFSPFLDPSPLPKRRRFKVSFPHNRSIATYASTSATPSDNSWGPRKELEGIQPVVDKLSPPVRLATSAVVIAGAMFAGFKLGSTYGGGSRNVAIGGAAVLGAAGGAMAYAMNAAVPEVAAKRLHDYVADCNDPGAVKREDIEAIANKYGVSKQDEAFNAELSDIYCRFVTSVLPPGGEDLRGDEVDKIIQFKKALGIDDPDAAAMHIEIGRRIFRQRLEVGDRDGDIEQRRAFQKLIYVSTLVFGEASPFLLPWKRVFKVTDSQVEIAIRENAKRLYASKLKLVGRDVDADHLVRLREQQLSYRLSDELAKDLFREHTRKLVEQNIVTALSILKSRTRAVKGVAQVVEELDKVLAFNNLLISLKEHPNADRLARGVGPVSLVGSEFDGDRKMDDLKLLYRAYVADSLSGGRMEENKLAALNQLRNVFGLGKRESEAITIDVTSKVYRKRLGQAVSGGALEAADSKASFLQNLCEELHFDPHKASQIHEEIYRQKLQQCVADGELNDEDVAALLRLRVMLCIPQQTVEAAHSDICGSLFEKVVKDAIASGVEGYDGEVKKAVRKAAHGLRLTREAAMSIASKAVRRIFMIYVKRARAAENRTEAAKELKKLITFNTLVVSELVADIKGESSDASEEEPITEEEKQTDEDKEEWESLESLKKITPSKELAEKMGKPGQREINLKDDLPERDRTDLYKTYLLYYLTGEVTKITFGASIKRKKDDSEYVMLSQLGGILGLTTKEIVDVHSGLAEQASSNRLKDEQFWVIGGTSTHPFYAFQGLLKVLARMDTNFNVIPDVSDEDKVIGGVSCMGFATIYFFWVALFGCLFQILILVTWVLPTVTPLLIRIVANNLVNVDANATGVLSLRGGTVHMAPLRREEADDIEVIGFDVILAYDFVYHGHLLDPMLKLLCLFLNSGEDYTDFMALKINSLRSKEWELLPQTTNAFSSASSLLSNEFHRVLKQKTREPNLREKLCLGGFYMQKTWTEIATVLNNMVVLTLKYEIGELWGDIFAASTEKERSKVTIKLSMHSIIGIAPIEMEEEGIKYSNVKVKERFCVNVVKFCGKVKLGEYRCWSFNNLIDQFWKNRILVEAKLLYGRMGDLRFLCGKIDVTKVWLLTFNLEDKVVHLGGSIDRVLDKLVKETYVTTERSKRQLLIMELEHYALDNSESAKGSPDEE